MPQVKDNFKFGARRGPSRKYKMDEYLDGQVWEFSAEEIAETYGVKAGSVASAARKDAERLTEQRTDGKVLLVKVSLPESDTVKDEQGKPAQGLIIQAYTVNKKQSEQAETETETETDNESDAGDGSARRGRK